MERIYMRFWVYIRIDLIDDMTADIESRYNAIEMPKGVSFNNFSPKKM